MCPKNNDCKHCLIENCPDRKEPHLQILNNDYSPYGLPIEYNNNDFYSNLVNNKKSYIIND